MRRTLLVPSLSPEGRGGGRYRRRGLQHRAMLTPSSTRASRSTRTTRGASGGLHHHHSRRPHTTMEAGLSPPTGQAGGNTPGTHTAGGIAFGRGVSRTPPLIQQRKFTRKMKHRNFGFGFPVGAKSLTRGGDTGGDARRVAGWGGGGGGGGGVASRGLASSHGWHFGLDADPRSKKPLSLPQLGQHGGSGAMAGGGKWMTRMTARDEAKRHALSMAMMRMEGAVDDTRPVSQSSQWMFFNNTRLMPNT